MRALNLGLRFLLELGMLAAFAYWGFRAVGPLPLRLLLGTGAPVLAAVIWGVFISPKAPMPLRPPVRFALELVLFGAAALALAAAGPATLAMVFGVTAWASSTLHFVLGSPSVNAR